MITAQAQTDKILSDIEKRIRKEYAQAAKETSAKLDDYFRRFETKDRIKRDQLKRGVITRKEYQQWRTNQMLIGERWTEMRETLADDLSHSDRIAHSVVEGYMPEVYALNHDFATYEVEKAARIDTSYILYNRQAVERVIRENPKMLPSPGKVTAEKIAHGQLQAWNEQRIQSVMIQGILQGESIPQLSKRMFKVTGGNYKDAIRNARTMTTGAENAGHADAYERARNIGIELEEQWVATLDSRTRDSHRTLDGEIKGEDGYFSNGLRYPGDPYGDPSEVYNCRCRLNANVKGFRRDMSDLSKRHSEKLGDMSYEEWKKGHGTSQSITHQEEIASGMKWRYINEDYRR